MDTVTGMDRRERLKDEIFKKVREYYYAVHHSDPGPSAPAHAGRINYAGRVFDENEMINLVDSSLDFWLTNGRYTRDFEAGFARYLNVRFALLVNSGSSANLLAFSALTSPLLGRKRICRGDEVITIAAGFPTTVSPVVQYGAVPVFVDVDLETFNVDPSLLEEAVTEKSRAVILAHTLGNPFDLNRVKKICDDHNLWLIEDNCDALGSLYEGRFTGTFGDIGTSSFYPPHHMTTGEGGAVYTNNPLLKKILLSMRDWGRDCWCESGDDNTCGARFSQQFGTLPPGYDHKYVYSHFGFNLKATDMQAAIGVAQLEKLSGFCTRRRENFQKLLAGLRDLEEYFIFPRATPGSDPSWFGFLITLRDGVKFTRNDLVTHMEARNIQTRNLFAGNILRHPAFDSMVDGRDFRVIGDLPNTEKIMNDSFWIGVYPGMNKESLEYMITEIRNFVRAYD